MVTLVQSGNHPSGRRFPVDERWSPRLRDDLWVVIVLDRLEEARAWLAENGWTLVGGDAAGDADTGAQQPAAEA